MRSERSLRSDHSEEHGVVRVFAASALHIALQHHGDFQGHPAETYRFRNLRVLPLGMRRWLRSEEAGLRWSVPGDSTWLESHSRVIWRPASQSNVEARMGTAPRKEFTIRFWCKPIEGGVRFILADSSGPVSVTLTPDERFGQVDRAESSPAPATKLAKPFFAHALWNAIAVSSRAGRIVVHVNGIRTADWQRPRAFAGDGFTIEAAPDSHVEFRDFEFLS